MLLQNLSSIYSTTDSFLSRRFGRSKRDGLKFELTENNGLGLYECVNSYPVLCVPSNNINLILIKDFGKIMIDFQISPSNLKKYVSQSLN